MPQLELLVGGEACGAIIATRDIVADVLHHAKVLPVHHSHRCARRGALAARLWL